MKTTNLHNEQGQVLIGIMIALFMLTSTLLHLMAPLRIQSQMASASFHALQARAYVWSAPHLYSDLISSLPIQAPLPPKSPFNEYRHACHSIVDREFRLYLGRFANELWVTAIHQEGYMSRARWQLSPVNAKVIGSPYW